jgi:hypothetical protein
LVLSSDNPRYATLTTAQKADADHLLDSISKLIPIGQIRFFARDPLATINYLFQVVQAKPAYTVVLLYIMNRVLLPGQI